MKNRSKIILISLIGSLVIIAILGVSLVVQNNLKSDAQNTAQQGNSTIARSLSGKSLNDDKLDAINAAAKLLNLSYGGETTKEALQARLTKIGSGDLSTVDKDINSQIDFSDILSENNYRISTYQALSTFAFYITQDNGNKKIVKADSISPDDIFLDQETGVAFIPISTFTSKGYFDLEMVYVDGTWKLAPYSMLRQISISSNLSKA